MKKYTFTKKIDTRSGFGTGPTELMGKYQLNFKAIIADVKGVLDRK